MKKLNKLLLLIVFLSPLALSAAPRNKKAYIPNEISSDRNGTTHLDDLSATYIEDHNAEESLAGYHEDDYACDEVLIWGDL